MPHDLLIASASQASSRVSVFTEWGPLEEVVLGSCRNFNMSVYDDTVSFLYDDPGKANQDVERPSIAQRFIDEREEDLDALAALLTQEGVTVRRAERMNRSQAISTPDFESVTTSCDAPRDMFLAYGSCFIETPPTNRKRFYEARLLRSIAREYFDAGARWIAAPRPRLASGTLDRGAWRDHIDDPFLDPSQIDSALDVAFDAANVLKFGRDLLMNVGTQNHLLGAHWLASVLPDGSRLHLCRLCDSHLDGHIMPLAPGRLLVNEGAMYRNYDRLPPELQKWDRIQILDPATDFDYPADHVQLATSVGMSVNVLSIDECRILIRDTAVNTIRALERAGFVPIPVRLRHSELFGGGIHCATVDVRRRDASESFLSA